MSSFNFVSISMKFRTYRNHTESQNIQLYKIHSPVVILFLFSEFKVLKTLLFSKDKTIELEISPFESPSKFHRKQFVSFLFVFFKLYEEIESVKYRCIKIFWGNYDSRGHKSKT